MAERFLPTRGGFLRPFGCGWFIREFLLGHGPEGAPVIDPSEGAPQTDICHHYKMALLRAKAFFRATKEEEHRAKREGREPHPKEIERLIPKYLERIAFNTNFCRYHSFVVYFATLQRLGWVEFTGHEEPSAFQAQYAEAPPRRYYRLTTAGREAPDYAWASPYFFERGLLTS